MGVLNASKDEASAALNNLRPEAVASIFIPLSAVVTARRFPSLLNLKRGRLWRWKMWWCKRQIQNNGVCLNNIKVNTQLRIILTRSPPSASVLVRMLTLSMSQNFIWLSSPTAKKRFWVVSNWTTPADFFLNPEYVLFIAPSLSFHSTRKESPSLLDPQENNLKERMRNEQDERISRTSFDQP